MFQAPRTLYDPSLAGATQSLLQQHVKTVFTTYKITEREVQNLEVSTRTQSQSAGWAHQRSGRITSSVAHDVKTVKFDRYPANLLRKIMAYNPPDLEKVPACQWGREKEDVARKQYIAVMTMSHTGFVCGKSGLVVPINHPFLGASPDGQTYCSCHGHGLLEIKCPYKYRCLSPDHEQALRDPHYCLGSDLALKKNHRYYTQVQHQLLVTQKEWCDFAVWTQEGMTIQRVVQDKSFCEELLHTMNKFLNDYLLPELLCRKLKPADALKESLTEDTSN